MDIQSVIDELPKTEFKNLIDAELKNKFLMKKLEIHEKLLKKISNQEPYTEMIISENEFDNNNIISEFQNNDVMKFMNDLEIIRNNKFISIVKKPGIFIVNPETEIQFYRN